MAASLVFAEYAQGLRYLIIVVGLLVVAAPTLRLQAAKHIQVNEALAIVALAFVISPLLMVYPMTGAGIGVMDALFESVSAVTTTGLTTVGSVQDKAKTFLFARAWIQWYGGLGIVVLSVALLMGHHMAARRLTEPTSGESLVTTARTYARRMLGVYVVLTSVGVVIAWLVVGDGFTAVAHILTAVSTAGFSTFDDNLAAIDSWPGRFVIISFALLGAVPLALYYRVYQHGWREAVADIELRALLVAILIVTVLLTGFMYVNANMLGSETLAHAVLLGISAQTSTGFSSLEVRQLDPASKLVLIAAMYVGGGVGSTAGGVKILRVLILLRLVQLVIQRTTMPSHAVLEPRLGGKMLESEDITRALLLLLLFAAVVLISWTTFVAFGHPSLDALFEVVSATGTVGLSTGVASPELHWALKMTLCIDMLFGRLEIIALLVILYPRTWFGKRATVA
jgi:trk system potassium uptake protein TrkH